jgi:hypothetical protein
MRFVTYGFDRNCTDQGELFQQDIWRDDCAFSAQTNYIARNPFHTPFLGPYPGNSGDPGPRGDGF